jgi:hypothetical protein
MQISHGCAYEIIHDTSLPLFCKMGFETTQCRSRDITVWTSVITFLASIMRKVTSFGVTLSLVSKCESTTMSQQMPEYGMEISTSPVKKMFKSQPTAGKVMFTPLGSQGPILEHYLEWGMTINSPHYSEMLHDKLKLEIQSKSRRQVPHGAVLLHKSAHPHTPAAIL